MGFRIKRISIDSRWPMGFSGIKHISINSAWPMESRGQDERGALTNVGGAMGIIERIQQQFR